MTEELKPCPNPWCMALDCSITTVRMVNPKTQEIRERKRVECTEGCGLCGPKADTDEAAAAAWNTRAESESIVSLRKLRDNAIEIAALRARVAELEAAQAWRPVDSAPAGCDLLLYCPDLGPTNRARVELRQFKNTRSGSMHAWATHWMPLPKGPE